MMPEFEEHSFPDYLMVACIYAGKPVTEQELRGNARRVGKDYGYLGETAKGEVYPDENLELSVLKYLETDLGVPLDDIQKVLEKGRKLTSSEVQYLRLRRENPDLFSENRESE
ncbi:MAG: hypothetical protein HY832_02825 [Candidatus Aenigmarchaeota archaeon]|nr:hypothetical protein [Candidatus Aenigmarchaeota archaeon]